MDLSEPFTTLTSDLEGSILLTLASTSRPLTGREVARLAGRTTHGATLKILNRLSDGGLVTRQEAGRALMYSLNRDHLLAPTVESLTNVRRELLKRLREAFASWDPAPTNASLFGSAARADGNTASDIDLLVVRPAIVDLEDPRWRSQLESLAGDVLRWTGNRANFAEVAESDFKTMSSDRREAFNQLLADAVTLLGADLGNLVREAV